MWFGPRELLQLILGLENVNSHSKQENIVDKDKYGDSGAHLADSNVSNGCSERTDECNANIVEVETLSLHIISQTNEYSFMENGGRFCYKNDTHET